MRIKKNNWYIEYIPLDSNATTLITHTTQKKILAEWEKLPFEGIEYAVLGERNSGTKLLTFEDGELWVEEGDRTLKSRHLGKCSNYKQWRK